MRPLRLYLGITLAISVYSAALLQAAAPAAPDSVKVAWIKNEEQFLVRWQPVPNATGYNVYRYEPTPDAWSRVAANLTFNPWNVPSFRQSSPGAGPTTFAVSALNADGEGPATPASVVPGPGLDGYFSADAEWWQKGYTFIDPSFVYSVIAEDTDGMVELGLDGTNFTHAAWNTNYQGGHSLHITNLTPGTVWVSRMTMVNSNGIGITILYPPWSVYTLPTDTISVWEDTPNTITIGHYSWMAPGQVFTPPQHGAIIQGNFSWDWTYTPEPNFTGTDTFQILDNPDGPPVTITLNVENINDLPVAYEVTVYVPEDTQSVFTPPV